MEKSLNARKVLYTIYQFSSTYSQYFEIYIFQGRPGSEGRWGGERSHFFFVVSDITRSEIFLRNFVFLISCRIISISCICQRTNVHTHKRHTCKRTNVHRHKRRHVQSYKRTNAHTYIRINVATRTNMAF